MEIAFPFIDIHTHHSSSEIGTIQVYNLFPGDAIPVFTGKNFYSVGLHPWKVNSEKDNNNLLQIMEDALELDHVIFIGECGLDKVAGTNFDEQLRVFKAQVIMAEEFERPLIIHCVKAFNELIEIYNENQPMTPWILHGYNGNSELCKQLSKRNLLFSFGETIFKVNAKAVDSLKYLPLNKIFFETDEYNGSVENVYERASEILMIPVPVLKETIWKNFNRIENVSLYL
jgi:TatD DNase family protein